MSHGHGRDSESCREMFARLSEYMDGELDPEICSSIDDHMEDCPPCRAFLESLRRTVSLSRELPKLEIPEEMVRELVDAYKKMQSGRP